MNKNTQTLNPGPQGSGAASSAANSNGSNNSSSTPNGNGDNFSMSEEAGKTFRGYTPNAGQHPQGLERGFGLGPGIDAALKDHPLFGERQQPPTPEAQIADAQARHTAFAERFAGSENPGGIDSDSGDAAGDDGGDGSMPKRSYGLLDGYDENGNPPAIDASGDDNGTGDPNAAAVEPQNGQDGGGGSNTDPNADTRFDKHPRWQEMRQREQAAREEAEQLRAQLQELLPHKATIEELRQQGFNDYDTLQEALAQQQAQKEFEEAWAAREAELNERYADEDEIRRERDYEERLFRLQQTEQAAERRAQRMEQNYLASEKNRVFAQATQQYPALTHQVTLRNGAALTGQQIIDHIYTRDMAIWQARQQAGANDPLPDLAGLATTVGEWMTGLLANAEEAAKQKYIQDTQARRNLPPAVASSPSAAAVPPPAAPDKKPDGHTFFGDIDWKNYPGMR